MAFVQKIRNFKNNTQGNVAIIFAISSVAILIAVAVAINITQLHSQKTKLGAAADAAVIAAVVAASEVLAADNTNADYRDVGIEAGKKSFALHIEDIKNISDVVPELTLNVTELGDLKGELTYRTTGETFLSGIIGKDKVDISDTVTAKKSIFKFSRINFLVDNSMSMGIGADSENQDLLFEATGCAIACHYRLSPSHQNTVEIARSLDIRLRMDTVKDALKQIVNGLNEKKESNQQFQVAIYTFSNSLETHLEPTTDFGKILSSIDDIEITNGQNQGGTNLSHSLDDLAVLLPASSTGQSQNKRQSYLIALTDGVENSVINATLGGSEFITQAIDPNFQTFQPSQFFPGHDHIQGMSPNDCDVFKSKNHTLAFINPTYLIPDTSATANGDRVKLDFIQDVLLDKIPSNSQACASSPSLSFSAETEAAVEQASEDLFNELFSQGARLTD